MGMVPQSRALPVLVTRPEPQASRFVRALHDRYGDLVAPVLTPLLAPTLLRPPLPTGPFGSVVLTSETGARAAGAFAADLPRRAYCVGDRTAEVAARSGFLTHSAAGDADRLVALLLERPEHAPFLHLRGREARGDLSARLVAAGLLADEAIVYAQDPQALSPEASLVLSGSEPVIVPLFSPRSAEVFCRALSALPQDTDLHARLRFAALSPAVAKVLADFPDRNIAISVAPTQAELFLALDRFIFTA